MMSLLVPALLAALLSSSPASSLLKEEKDENSHEELSPPKILVYNPRFAHSHSNFMGNIADALAEAGHNVTSLVEVLYPGFSDCTSKSRVILVPGYAPSVEMYGEWMNGESGMAKIWLGSSEDQGGLLKQMPVLRDSFAGQCNFTLHQHGLIERLRREHFDVVIAENFNFCGIGISHLISPRSLIIASTTNLFDYQAYQLGAPLAASHVPGSFAVKMEEMTMWQRLKNLYFIYCHCLFFGGMELGAQNVFSTLYGATFPQLGEVTANASFVLTNTDPLADFSRPTLRNIIDIGGLGVKAQKPLAQEWLDILDLRPRTVIVSFGTVSRSYLMPEEYKAALLLAIRRFPLVTFIWKYEKANDSLPVKADNVVLVPWMPQNDLLYDNRVVALISHAGKGSVGEAAVHGVPALFIPLFADQPRNAATAAHLGVGRIIDKLKLGDEETLAAEIKELLESESLRKNARALKRTLAGRPFQARDLLVQTVAFASRFGPQKALDYSGRRLSFLAFHNLDITLAGVALLLALLFFLSSLFLAATRFMRIQLQQSNNIKIKEN